MIRGAQQNDWQDIMDIYAIARAFMKQAGNPTQWGNNDPDPAVIRRDMDDGNFFVLEREGRVQAVFSLVPGPDPTYGEIDGAWLRDTPYWAIHRVASRGEAHGLTGEIFRWCMDPVRPTCASTPTPTTSPCSGPLKNSALSTAASSRPTTERPGSPLRKSNRQKSNSHNKTGRFFQRNGPFCYRFGLIRRSKTAGGRSPRRPLGSACPENSG